MTRSTILLFLFAAISVDFIAARSVRQMITIDTPELYENLKAGQYNETYYVLHVKSTAHPNVLGEAKFIGETPGLVNTRTIFQDEHGNYIAIEPMSKELEAVFTMGELSEDRFGSFPTNYEIYSIDLPTTTSADLDFIEKWHLSEKIMLSNYYYPDNDVMEHVYKLRELINLQFSVYR